MKDKKLKIFLAFLLLFAFFITFVKVFHSKPRFVFYTEDIQDYNTEKYPFFSSIFLPCIPKNASVTKFVYYNYIDEEIDSYLELKFNSVEDLDCYLLAVKEHYEQSENTRPQITRFFVEKTNEFDDNYENIYCIASNYTSSYDEEYDGYIGYEFYEEEYKSLFGKLDASDCYDCLFDVISYSYSELTVIQSSVRGNFLEYFHEYIPYYFIKFKAELEPGDEYRLFFKNR